MQKMKTLKFTRSKRAGSLVSDSITINGVDHVFTVSKRRKTGGYYCKVQYWLKSQKSDKRPTGHFEKELKILGEAKGNALAVRSLCYYIFKLSAKKFSIVDCHHECNQCGTKFLVEYAGVEHQLHGFHSKFCEELWVTKNFYEVRDSKSETV